MLTVVFRLSMAPLRVCDERGTANRVEIYWKGRDCTVRLSAKHAGRLGARAHRAYEKLSSSHTGSVECFIWGLLAVETYTRRC
eukprot:1981942-Pyramimonas_sp.AAC.2